MLNNDFLKGYVQALDNIDSQLKDQIKQIENAHSLGSLSQRDKDMALKASYQTEAYIKQVKNNYKKLVKDLNEKSDSKS